MTHQKVLLFGVLAPPSPLPLPLFGPCNWPPPRAGSLGKAPTSNKSTLLGSDPPAHDSARLFFSSLSTNQNLLLKANRLSFPKHLGTKSLVQA